MQHLGHKIEVPRSVPGLVTNRLLVMNYLDGVPITRMRDQVAFKNLSEATKRAAAGRIVSRVAEAYGRMVLLDEINIALRYDYLDVAEVVAFLQDEKPDTTHVVLTGRNAKDEVIEIADLVTEMELVKHPFRSGVKAQAGVEF